MSMLQSRIAGICSEANVYIYNAETNITVLQYVYVW